jgi:hypothetical protein
MELNIKQLKLMLISKYLKRLLWKIGCFPKRLADPQMKISWPQKNNIGDT